MKVLSVYFNIFAFYTVCSSAMALPIPVDDKQTQARIVELKQSVNSGAKATIDALNNVNTVNGNLSDALSAVQQRDAKSALVADELRRNADLYDASMGAAGTEGCRIYKEALVYSSVNKVLSKKKARSAYAGELHNRRSAFRVSESEDSNISSSTNILKVDEKIALAKKRMEQLPNGDTDAFLIESPVGFDVDPLTGESEEADLLEAKLLQISNPFPITLPRGYGDSDGLVKDVVRDSSYNIQLSRQDIVARSLTSMVNDKKRVFPDSETEGEFISLAEKLKRQSLKRKVDAYSITEMETKKNAIGVAKDTASILMDMLELQYYSYQEVRQSRLMLTLILQQHNEKNGYPELYKPKPNK